MKYRIDPRSGNKLSILGFGCMRFPRNLSRIDMDKTEKLVLLAIDKGINYFDTAYLYFGSEEALGAILEKHKLREKVYIATKLPIINCKTYEDFDRFFKLQLEHLRTNYVDYYFMHSLSDMNTWKHLCELGIEKWITEKKASGQIKQVGFSFHGTQAEFMELLDAYDWDFTQIQYNYVNTNYQAGTAGLKKAAEKGLPVIIMEPLLGGKLASGLPQKAVELLKNADASLSPTAWSLRWLWDAPEVTLVLSGMNDFPQIKENITLADNSMAGMLTQKEHETVKSVVNIFNESFKIPCTGCNYCIPCPQRINIPACFSAYNMSHTVGKMAGFQQYMTATGAMDINKKASASDCVKCGKCEKHCPQHIQIIKSMELVSKRMEPLWFKPVIRLVRRITSK